MSLSQSEIALCNDALFQVGCKQKIMSTDDTSAPAITCKTVLPRVKHSLFRSYPWSCLLTRSDLLDRDATTPPFGYLYSHVIPSDCLRIYRINNVKLSNSDYQKEGRRILSNREELYILYVRTTSSMADLDATLYEALVYMLAKNIAVPISGKSSIFTAMAGAAKESILEAVSIDSTENKELPHDNIQLWTDAIEYGTSQSSDFYDYEPEVIP